MVREYQLARRQPAQAATSGDGRSWALSPAHEVRTLGACQHRTVARDGRIVCSRIVEGESEVSPNVCRECPFKAVNCAHLRFSLRQESASPLVVRFNGRTEIWDDGPDQLSFERAACSAKVIPIHEPRSCTGCTMRSPIQAVQETGRRRPVAAASGKVVAFPSHEPIAVAG